MKKARKQGLMAKKSTVKLTKQAVGRLLFEVTAYAQSKGWSAEGLLRDQYRRSEKELRRQERKRTTA